MSIHNDVQCAILFISQDKWSLCERFAMLATCLSPIIVELECCTMLCPCDSIVSCSGGCLPGQQLSHAALQALLLQEPGLKAQLVATLPAGVQLASNATAADAVPAQAQGPSSEAGDEVIDKRGASMLLGCALPCISLPSLMFPPAKSTSACCALSYHVGTLARASKLWLASAVLYIHS